MQSNGSRQLISFVFPIYNEEDTIHKLYEEVCRILTEVEKTYDTEVICVNDGSRDGSANLLFDLSKRDTRWKVISFAKNFGHQIAVTAGQDHASGDAVIIMDADLQDPPYVALELITKWEEGYEIVYAKRRSYNAHPVKKFLGYTFYRLLKNIASVDIPVDTGDFRLLSKRVNEQMKRFKEKSRYLRGMTSLMGYKSTFVEFDRADRYAGVTNYPFQKSLKLALDGITGFSTYPLKLITTTGIWMSLFSVVFGIAYIIFTLITHTNISGWVSLFAAVIFMGGVQLFMLGVLGEYIGRIYTEVLDRPLYTVARYSGFAEFSDKGTTVQRN